MQKLSLTVSISDVSDMKVVACDSATEMFSLIGVLSGSLVTFQVPVRFLINLISLGGFQISFSSFGPLETPPELCRGPITKMLFVNGWLQEIK